MCVWVCGLSRVQLCDPVDCSPSDFSVNGIFQARILEWVPIFYSRVSFWFGDQTGVSQISYIGRWILYHLPEKPNKTNCICNNAYYESVIDLSLLQILIHSDFIKN